MITKITVNTDTHSDLPWPADLSLPAAGDAVTLQFGAMRSPSSSSRAASAW